ncbi:(p)ppGpp synthetase [Pigmentiphaga sp. H8]|uniref:(p)ppGpp synthetase n=1 Tax=Pigmentiphaga sp. H8 TaxID=2488560 RepID=UPI000F59219B|nr:(p)ppGpp synthetase [Pigmentiphaga sp. H8]AZG10202.1 (p)ppGpp synthetase [Pigmentiphaga sp. H8]
MIAPKKKSESVASILKAIREQYPVIEGFGTTVEAILTKDPRVVPVIHSFKRRLKEEKSIKEKIMKKRLSGVQIDSNNVFSEVTDIYAVRLIHLYPHDVRVVHNVIVDHAAKKDWILVEKPKAYTWDPDSIKFLKSLGLKCELKSSFYTSVHYLVKPRKNSAAICEIQVRSLLEEVWGEVDHKIKYKGLTEDERINEHLAVLARLISAGSRILSAIQKK